MKQWIPLKIVLITGIAMLIQYFIPHESFEFIYEYSIDFTIIIAIFAMALGIWSLVRVSYEKIKRKALGYGYSWVTLIGLVMMLFFGFFPFGADSMRVGNVGDQPSAVQISDVDFDNDNDIIVSNYKTNNVSIFKNRGNGLFISAYTYKAGENPSALAMCDLDGDADQDIIVTNDTSKQISVLMNEGQKSDFKPSKLQITPDKRVDSLQNAGKPKFSKPINYSCGTTPKALAVGDLDGDGKSNDLVVANQDSRDISVFINNGDGTLKNGRTIPVGFSPAALHLADLNRDLNNDLVVISDETGELAILYGNGQGDFAAPEKLAVSDSKLSSVTAGDFDQNGYFDLALTSVASDQSGKIIILLSDSTSLLGQAQEFETGALPVGILGDDFDQDGYRDLAVTCQGDNVISVHWNDGQGGFADTTRLYTGRTPVHAAAGILENGQLPTLVAANQVSNNVATLTNLGNREFKPGQNLESGDILYIGGELRNYFYRQLFYNIMIPIQATMFSLLAFYIASAAYRAFRARSLLASILLAAALIIMIRFAPLGPISGAISDLAGWILRIPNMAAKRAIFIGVGLGMVATAIKVLLGIERTYMGRD